MGGGAGGGGGGAHEEGGGGGEGTFDVAGQTWDHFEGHADYWSAWAYDLMADYRYVIGVQRPVSLDAYQGDGKTNTNLFSIDTALVEYAVWLHKTDLHPAPPPPSPRPAPHPVCVSVCSYTSKTFVNYNIP